MNVRHAHGEALLPKNLGLERQALSAGSMHLGYFPLQAVIIDERGQKRCPTLASKKQVESHIAFQSTVEVPSCLPMPSKKQVESGQKSQTAYRERSLKASPDQEGASTLIHNLT